MASINKKNKCKLLPYEIEETLSMQEAGDRPGWNVTAFDLPTSWKHTKGEGIKIAVLDTGCDLDHPDLRNNLLPGVNLVNKKKDPWDDNKHGTHCTGTICAEKNGLGIIGVAPKAKVMPVKVLDGRGSGNFLTVAQGIRWAVKNGADMISMSLGSPNKVQQVRKAVQMATRRNVPIFVAAGNAGNTKHIFYPARYPETIAIGSIDQNFSRSSFSNTGKNLDFMAPGGKILSTVPDDWYATLSGTSMACPFAVGVAALVLSYTRNHDDVPSVESVQQLRNIFKSHTTPITNKGYAGKKFFQGFGIIDPRKFLEWLDENKK
tara:strand:+ start:10135 stop:11091 length:957 start_codon:yes stop_codon:yes gene_type:complete